MLLSGNRTPSPASNWVHRADALQGAVGGCSWTVSSRPAISGVGASRASRRGTAPPWWSSAGRTRRTSMWRWPPRAGHSTKGRGRGLPARPSAGEILQRFAAPGWSKYRGRARACWSPSRWASRSAMPGGSNCARLTRCLRFYGEAGRQGVGRGHPDGRGELSLVTREPAGVIASRRAVEFPAHAGRLESSPPALACRPAPWSSRTAEQSAAVHAAGGPARPGGGDCRRGVFNVLSGDGLVAGRALGEHPERRRPDLYGIHRGGSPLPPFTRRTATQGGVFLGAGRQVRPHHPSRRPGPGMPAAGHGGPGRFFFNSGEMCTAGSPPGGARGRGQIASSSGSSRRRRHGFPQTRCSPPPRWGPWSTGGAWTGSRPSCGAGQAQGRDPAPWRQSGAGPITGGAYLEPTVVHRRWAGQRPWSVRELFGPVFDRAGDHG